MLVFKTLDTVTLIELFDILNKGINTQILSYVILMALIFGILAILTNNPIMSVLFLIGLYIFVSIDLGLIGLTFIALAYLLVYVGAVI